MLSRLPRVLREGGVLAWQHLLSLVGLNLLWIAGAATGLLLGPATLSVYGHLAALRDDQSPALQSLPGRFRQALLPGLAWALTVAAFAFLAWANLTYWPRVLSREGLGQLGLFAVGLLWGYLIWLFVALQPYLLEALAVRRLPYRQAVGAALLEVVRRPVSAHLFVLIPLALYGVGNWFQTPALVVLVSLLLTFAAVQVRPVTVREPPGDEPEDGSGGTPPEPR